MWLLVLLFVVILAAPPAVGVTVLDVTSLLGPGGVVDVELGAGGARALGTNAILDLARGPGGLTPGQVFDLLPFPSGGAVLPFFLIPGGGAGGAVIRVDGRLEAAFWGSQGGLATSLGWGDDSLATGAVAGGFFVGAGQGLTQPLVGFINDPVQPSLPSAWTGVVDGLLSPEEFVGTASPGLQAGRPIGWGVGGLEFQEFPTLGYGGGAVRISAWGACGYVIDPSGEFLGAAWSAASGFSLTQIGAPGPCLGITDTGYAIGGISGAGYSWDSVTGLTLDPFGQGELGTSLSLFEREVLVGLRGGSKLLLGPDPTQVSGIPEPETWVLFGSGLLLILLAARLTTRR